MARQRGIGKTGMVLAAVVACTMCVLAYFVMPQVRISGNMGLCLPSPNLWPIPPLWSWVANGCLTVFTAIGYGLLNRRYNYIKTSQPIVPALFLVMAASNPFTIQYVSGSTLLCLVNLLCLFILFDCYRLENTTSQIFVISTFISFGSMFQHAFIPFLLAYVAGAIIMKAFRFKELLAMILGLIAPYWIGLGLGLIKLNWFKIPELSNLFDGFAPPADLMVIIVGFGVAAFFGFFLSINNSIRLYAGNSRVYALNQTINFVGIISMLGIMLDFSNMMAYATTLYFVFAVQIANLCAQSNFRREWILSLIPAIIYVVLFIILAAT